MISQMSFGFMAVPLLRQWICHSPNVMKTDIFGAEGRREWSIDSGSIRFDSPVGKFGLRN